VTGKDRQRELERARYERVQARLAEQQAAARKRNKIVAFASVAAIVVVGVGVPLAIHASDSGKKSNAAATTPSSAPSASDTASPSADPSSSAETVGYQKTGQASKDVGVPTYNAADAAKPYTATLHLSQGDVTFTALTDKAPYTTYSFEYLAGKKYFDATKCHRLTTSSIYVLQCGDPTGTGSGGPGYQFQDENLTGATYPAGTIAMANAGPGTNGSQFFIVYQDTQLPPSYTPWGKITSGLDVVQGIAKDGVADGSGDGAPKDTVTIKSVDIKAG
jgi:peptidyl-prolyl cis-trans isomerase B (cyclophilin B)